MVALPACIELCCHIVYIICPLADIFGATSPNDGAVDALSSIVALTACIELRCHIVYIMCPLADIFGATSPNGGAANALSSMVALPAYIELHVILYTSFVLW